MQPMTISITGSVGPAVSASPPDARKTAETPPPEPAASPSLAATSPKVVPADVAAHYDDVLKTIVMTISDPSTGAVLSQIPSEGLQSLVHRTIEFQAKFLDMKI
jgi:hypothetical protein